MWKEDLSGKQLGEARDQDSYGRNEISWSQHMSRWFSLSEQMSWNGVFVLMALSSNEEEVEGYI